MRRVTDCVVEQMCWLTNIHDNWDRITVRVAETAYPARKEPLTDINENTLLLIFL